MTDDVTPTPATPHQIKVMSRLCDLDATDSQWQSILAGIDNAMKPKKETHSEKVQARIEELRTSKNDDWERVLDSLVGRVSFWADAFTAQVDRVSSQAGFTAAAARDARVAVMALAQVLSMVERLTDLDTDLYVTSASLKEMLAGDDPKRLRDVLMHEEDYILDVGRREVSGTPYSGTFDLRGDRLYSVAVGSEGVELHSIAAQLMIAVGTVHGEVDHAKSQARTGRAREAAIKVTDTPPHLAD